MARKVEAYQTAGGALFLTVQEAHGAERREALRKWLDELCRHTTVQYNVGEEDEVIDYFLAHEASLRAALDGRFLPDVRGLVDGQPESPEDPHEPLDLHEPLDDDIPF